MATTAGGTPYVESSDLVADYPTVSLALAEHIDDLPAAVLQVVRATDATDRTTTSTSFVDASLSVTITPQKSDSAILLICAVQARRANANEFIYLQIADSSNNAVNGAEFATMGSTATGAANQNALQTILGRDTPATTSATTYKLRFRSLNANAVELANADNTAQLYAIEVSA